MPSIQNPKGAPRGLRPKIQDPRVVLAGCPTGFPDTAIVELIERCGLHVVGEHFGAHDLQPSERPRPAGGRKAILRWVAEALCVNGEGAGGKGNPPLSALVCERAADGLIWLHYRGCAVGAMDQRDLDAQLPRPDFPKLIVEVDQIGFGEEALQTRLEAFREQLLSLNRV